LKNIARPKLPIADSRRKYKKMNKLLYHKIQLIIALLVSVSQLQAQRRMANKQADSLAALREFMLINSSLRQMPVYLEMELINSTNFIAGEQDTAQVQSIFYMKPGVSYIRFGEAEQLVNDSMALLVSDKLQRMVLYSHAQPILSQMKAFTGMQGLDSSIAELSKKFTAQLLPPSGNTASIILTGRSLLYGTSLAKESLELQYDAEKKQPLKMITVKRTLLPVPEENYKALAEQGTATDKLVTIEGKGHFLVKEQAGTFVYKKITHDADITLPATINDRIIMNEQGAFTPVKAYEAYAVTIN
jgi:hypothetical protein